MRNRIVPARPPKRKKSDILVGLALLAIAVSGAYLGLTYLEKPIYKILVLLACVVVLRAINITSKRVTNVIH
jgi:hypothetical protein